MCASSEVGLKGRDGNSDAEEKLRNKVSVRMS